MAYIRAYVRILRVEGGFREGVALSVSGGYVTANPNVHVKCSVHLLPRGFPYVTEAQ